MLQEIIIAMAVLGAAGYVMWSFLPLRRRQWLLDALATHGVLARAASRHRARLATPGCNHCPVTEQHAPSKGKPVRR